MKRSMLSAACLLVGFLVVGTAVSNAQAQGCGAFGGPHQYYGNYGGYYGSYTSGYGNVGYGNVGYGNSGYGNSGYGNSGYGVYPGYGVVPFSTNYGGGWGGHSHWHDTTHLDYHPGEVVRHRNHYHYVPGHYDVHEEGHWDHHGW